jgi:hypothetical protein
MWWWRMTSCKGKWSTRLVLSVRKTTQKWWLTPSVEMVGCWWAPSGYRKTGRWWIGLRGKMDQKEEVDQIEKERSRCNILQNLNFYLKPVCKYLKIICVLVFFEKN